MINVSELLNGVGPGRILCTYFLPGFSFMLFWRIMIKSHKKNFLNVLVGILLMTSEFNLLFINVFSSSHSEDKHAKQITIEQDTADYKAPSTRNWSPSSPTLLMPEWSPDSRKYPGKSHFLQRFKMLNLPSGLKKKKRDTNKDMTKRFVEATRLLF